MSSKVERIRDEAAQWLVRLDDPACDPGLRAAFQKWLQADVRHRAAYLRLEAAWRRADVLKHMRPADGAVDPDLLS